jgi:hypothetical protein
MPNLNGMKFPYTPAGKQRYQQIKKQISQKVTRPSNGVKPINIGKPSGGVKVGAQRPVGGATPPKRRPIDPGYGKRPFPIKRVPR